MHTVHGSHPYFTYFTYKLHIYWPEQVRATEWQVQSAGRRVIGGHQADWGNCKVGLMTTERNSARARERERENRQSQGEQVDHDYEIDRGRKKTTA